MNKHDDMWKKKMKKTMKNISRSFPELIRNFWVKWETTEVLFLRSLSTLASRSIRMILQSLPILAKRANTFGFDQLSPVGSTMSNGKIEIKSIQNHPLRYFFAITSLSVISYTLFSSGTEVKNVSMRSIRKNTSVMMQNTNQDELSCSTKARRTGTIKLTMRRSESTTKSHRILHELPW